MLLHQFQQPGLTVGLEAQRHVDPPNFRPGRAGIGQFSNLRPIFLGGQEQARALFRREGSQGIEVGGGVGMMVGKRPISNMFAAERLKLPVE